MEKNHLEQQDTATFHTLAFATRKAAEEAYEDLVGLGVSPNDISLFVHAEPFGDRQRDAVLGHDIDVGGAVGAGASALAGGAGGLFAGLGLLAVPGFGPLLPVGPIAAALTGAIMGGLLGGVAGSLIGAGVFEASALAAGKHLAAGHAIVTVADAAWNERLSEAARRSPALISIDHPEKRQ